MNTAIQRESITFPRGFLDFLNVSPGRRRRIGEYELDPFRLECFNQALHQLSPAAAGMTMDQIATAAERALAHQCDGGTPSFVQSRMASLARLETMAADQAWDPGIELQRQVAVLHQYRQETGDLIPDQLPVIGLLDDAILVDVALQLLRDELADYEDFCRFRRVAAAFAGTSEADTGLIREHWLEAMMQAHASLAHDEAPTRMRYAPAPAPGASLFHIA